MAVVVETKLLLCQCMCMYVHRHGLLPSFGICHARVRAQTQIDIIYCIIPFSSDMRMDDLFVCQYVKQSVSTRRSQKRSGIFHVNASITERRRASRLLHHLMSRSLLLHHLFLLKLHL